MTAIRRLLDALDEVRDVNGEPCFGVAPPVTPATLDQWTASGLLLPGDMIDVARCTEAVGGAGGIDLDLRDPLERYVDDLLGPVVIVGNDGTGGSLLLDEAGRLWFMGHDPNCLTLAGRSVGEWLGRIREWDPDATAPDRTPVLPRTFLVDSSEGQVPVDALRSGEGFEFELHDVTRVGGHFVVQRA